MELGERNISSLSCIMKLLINFSQHRGNHILQKGGCGALTELKIKNG